MNNLTGLYVIFSDEPTVVYLVLEDNGNRVLAEAQDTGLNYAPTCTVGKNWISMVGK